MKLIAIFLPFLIISCAHNSRYHVVESKFDNLSSVTLQRRPASFSVKNRFRAMSLRCYNNPNKISIQEVYTLTYSPQEKKFFLLTLSNCLRAKQQYTASFHILRQLLAIVKTNHEKEIVYSNLLSLALLKKQYFLAKNFTVILQNFKSRAPITNYNIAQFYLTQYLPTKALPFLQQAKAQAPQDIDITLLLAQTYITKKNYTASKALLTTISSLESRSDVAITKAYTLMQLGDYTAAQKLLTNIGIYLNSEDDIAARYLEIIEQTLNSKQDQKS